MEVTNIPKTRCGGVDMSKKETTKNHKVEPTEQSEQIEKVEKSEQVEQNQTLIYVGESLKNGRLHQFSVFNNGIPPFLKEDIEKCPAIKALMVPIAQSGIARQRLTIQGTVEHSLNTQIQQYVRSDN